MPGKVLISYTWTYCMVGNLHGYKLVNRPKSGFQKFFRGFNLRNQWCWKTIFVCQLYHVILAQWLKLGDLNSSWGEQYSDITELSTWLLVFLAKHLRTSLFICLFAFCTTLISTWRSHQRHACLQAFTGRLEVVLGWNMTCLPWMKKNLGLFSTNGSRLMKNVKLNSLQNLPTMQYFLAFAVPEHWPHVVSLYVSSWKYSVTLSEAFTGK